MCENFAEVNAYLCHHHTKAGFEPLNQAGAKQSYAVRTLPVTTRPREQLRF